jgi:hypothetical protein
MAEMPPTDAAGTVSTPLPELDLSLDDRLTNVDTRLAMLVEAVNSLGSQMNWLCENLAQMFAFMGQVSANGGGVRGLMTALKQSPPTPVAPDQEVTPE